MKISSIGGEMNLIERIKGIAKRKEVLLGQGDDAAIINAGKKEVLLTIDSLVEGSHFSSWFSAKQIGMKAMEVNASDIAAMGGKPLYALASVTLTKNSSVEFVEELYKGIKAVGRKYWIDVIGGDFVKGNERSITIAMIGERRKGLRCRRSDARIGDYIMVSGSLGASTAGLNLFLKKIKGFNSVKKKHLEPKAQLKKALKIAPFANAMEDVSDGLASEVKNICSLSKCGAVIFAEKIPVSKKTRKAAKKMRMNALDFALFGGEDFELVFTVNKKNLSKVKGIIVGKIIREKKIYLEEKGKKELLRRRGYDHFA
ncbi:MAG: thiamine-phosphate kinase [archaeon]